MPIYSSNTAYHVCEYILIKQYIINNNSNLILSHTNRACTPTQTKIYNRPESGLALYESEKKSEHSVPLQEDSAATVGVNHSSLNKQYAVQ
jgi:hypothetical protein